MADVTHRIAAEGHHPCLCCDPPRCEADKCAEVGRLYAECAPIDRQENPVNGNMAQARETLGHVVCEALPPAHTGTHLPSAHDVRVAIRTLALVFDYPDVVLTALGFEKFDEDGMSEQWERRKTARA